MFYYRDYSMILHYYDVWIINLLVSNREAMQSTMR